MSTHKLSTALRYLRDYVAIPSVNPMGRDDISPEIAGEARYAARVQQDLAALGAPAVLVGDPARPSVIADLRSASAVDTLLIASHLDTVPVDTMTIDPFDPVVSAGRLQGRGACDTKAGMASLMAALAQVLQRGRLRRNLIVVGEADEELSSIGVRDVIQHLAGRKVDWVLATEPTGLRVVTHHKGRATLTLESRGRAGHSSEPERADNAIVWLARAVVALDELSRELSARRDERLGAGTLAVTLIGGGQASNIIPDRAVVTVDRRTLPDDSLGRIRDEVQASLVRAGLAEHVHTTDVTEGKPALGTVETHPAVQHCGRALSACSLPVALGSVAFATDAGPFAAHGIPGVVMGPGEIVQAHTADEWVDIEQVEAMTRFFVRLLEGDTP
jgi:acetylornithine deacetylase